MNSDFNYRITVTLRVSVPPEASAILTEVGVKSGLLNDGLFYTVPVPAYEQIIKSIIIGDIRLTPSSQNKSTKQIDPAVVRLSG